MINSSWEKIEGTQRLAGLEWVKSPVQHLHRPSTSCNNLQTSPFCRQNNNFGLIYSNVRNDSFWDSLFSSARKVDQIFLFLVICANFSSISRKCDFRKGHSLSFQMWYSHAQMLCKVETVKTPWSEDIQMCEKGSTHVQGLFTFKL